MSFDLLDSKLGTVSHWRGLGQDLRLISKFPEFLELAPVSCLLPPMLA